MTLLSLAVLILAAGAGLVLLAVGGPGNWLVLAGILAAVALSPQAALSLGTVLLLLTLCLGAEVVEALCTVVGARRYGVSGSGVWGAVIGGFGGALAGGSLLPVVGAIPGGFAGAFLGAFGLELARGRSRHEALRSGFGAFLARMLGLIVKVGATVAMASLGVFWLL